MPLVIRLTHNMQRRYLPTPHFVFGQQLDRNGEIKDKNIKIVADNIYRQVKELLDGLSFRVAAYTPDELKDYLLRKMSADGAGKIDFFEFAEKYISDIYETQTSTATGYKSALNNLERYLGKRRLEITGLTSAFFYKYQGWMEKSGSVSGGPLGERGQSFYLGNIRTIFNVARQQHNDYDREDVPIPNRPFERFKIKKARNIKTAEEKALSIAQIRAIRDYTPVRVVDELAHDIFMLSFYLCGMNAVDFYRCSELKEGIIRYYRSKVSGRREDKADMRVRVEPEAAPLVEKYRGKKPAVFNFSERYSSRGSFVGALNRGLKTVGKAVGIDDLEFYYARHSWATIAANECEISIDTIEDCLAHSDTRLAKRAYIKKDWEIVYSANRKVLDALNKKKE